MYATLYEGYGAAEESTSSLDYAQLLSAVKDPHRKVEVWQQRVDLLRAAGAPPMILNHAIAELNAAKRAASVREAQESSAKNLDVLVRTALVAVAAAGIAIAVRNI